MKFVPEGPMDYTFSSGQALAWRRTGDKPQPEPAMIQFENIFKRSHSQLNIFSIDSWSQLNIFSNNSRFLWKYFQLTPLLANDSPTMMTSSNGNNFRVTGHLCGDSPATSEFPTKKPVTWSFDVSFDLRQNKRLSKRWESKFQKRSHQFVTRTKT